MRDPGILRPPNVTFTFICASKCFILGPLVRVGRVAEAEMWLGSSCSRKLEWSSILLTVFLQEVSQTIPILKWPSICLNYGHNGPYLSLILGVVRKSYT